MSIHKPKTIKPFSLSIQFESEIKNHKSVLWLYPYKEGIDLDTGEWIKIATYVDRPNKRFIRVYNRSGAWIQEFNDFTDGDVIYDSYTQKLYTKMNNQIVELNY